MGNKPPSRMSETEPTRMAKTHEFLGVFPCRTARTARMDSFVGRVLCLARVREPERSDRLSRAEKLVISDVRDGPTWMDADACRRSEW
jgi:hypothetical protein